MDNCENNKMLPDKLQQLRGALGLPQRKVAAVLDIISEGGYEPITIQNPSAYLVNSGDWNITPDSCLYEYV